jgi:hypothetical protein
LILGQDNSVTATTTLRNTETTEPGLLVFTEGASAIAGQSGGEGGHGVQGIAASENGAGVWGHNPGPGAGVAGSSNDGVGVSGSAVAGTAIMAQATTDGTALDVHGKVVFSRSGVITVAKGRSSAVKGLQGVTMSSLVFAVVRNGDAKAWVRKAAPGTNEFTVLMNKEVSSATTVAWFVLD